MSARASWDARRSVVLAGARTVVLSLWKVPDLPTASLIQRLKSSATPTAVAPEGDCVHQSATGRRSRVRRAGPWAGSGTLRSDTPKQFQVDRAGTSVGPSETR